MARGDARRAVGRVALVAVLLAGAALPAVAQSASVDVIRVDGVIGPATAGYIVRAIGEAEAHRAAALVVELNTPGGILSSAEEITKAMLAARVPVVVYVTPSGGRAASAGVFITYAAHVAAMAPTTRIGAASVVSLGGEGQQPDQTMMRKVTNDAVANIRGIAKARGRNADWGEQAIRNAASVTEEDALRLRVVDLVAADRADLLRRLDGRVVRTAAGQVTLRTAGAPVVEVPMDTRERFLNVLAEPNIGLLLMTIAIYGIIFELSNPGAILPGVVGGIALVLGLVSLAIIQVNYAGLALIALSVVFFVADIKVPGHGVLTVGGVLSFIFGAILLTSRNEPYLQISLQMIIALALSTAAFFLFAVGAGVRAQRAAVTTGRVGLVGATGRARTPIAPEGMVFLHGELWSARAEDGDIPPGEAVRVIGVEGLTLRVERIPRSETTQ